MTEAGQTVCLNMIVKDEAEVIARCLASVRPFVDCWTIVDTGSTDATRELVREQLADLPGELHERPWVDFGHNRSEALALARGRADYVLVIDADETLEPAPGFVLPPLTADAYDLEVRYEGVSYLRRQLLRDALEWSYRGVLHEHVHCDAAETVAALPGLVTRVRHDGARSRDPLTYRRDALVLERALLDEPDNARYAFYLAQSLRDGGQLERAIEAYERRIELGGWSEETWFSRYQIALLRERLERPWPEVQQAYLAAFAAAPDRAEPLFRIGLHHQAQRDHAVAQLFFAHAMTLPPPALDRLFVERPLYDYLLPVEHAVAAYWTGDHATAVRTNNALLRSGRVPPEAIGRIVRNRRYSLDARHPALTGASAGAVRVVLVARDPGPELDDAVESVLDQQDAACEVVVIDDGSRSPLGEHLPADPRVRPIRGEADGRDAALGAFVAGHCAPHDLVLALPAGESLADRNVVAAVTAAFADPGCRLAYGPRRRLDGRWVAGEPVADAAAFATAGAAARDGAMLCFRASLWTEAAAAAGAVPDADALWRAAGFDGTRFLDTALTRELAPDEDRTKGSRMGTVAYGPPADRPSSVPAPPSVSCLMISRDRLGLARLAMRSFADQTHADRELVIVSEAGAGYRRALRRSAEQLELDNVRIVAAEPGTPLGALRNLSLDAADGDVVCQWDDDDLSHPQRVATQLDGMLRAGARACFLTDHLQYLEREGLVYWIDWTLGGRATEEMQLFPGTVMLWRDPRFRYPESGPYARRGEDSALVNQLFRSVPIARLPGMGHMYLYRYHGRNTFSEEHHMRITSCCSPVAHVLPHAERIREALAYYPIPKPVAVLGLDGPALAVG